MNTQLKVFENALVLDTFETCDIGLKLNERDGMDFWARGEVVQFWGTVNGVKVWIERATGRMSCNGKPMFRVAFGECPEYPYQINQDEAVRLLSDRLGITLTPNPSPAGRGEKEGA